MYCLSRYPRQQAAAHREGGVCVFGGEQQGGTGAPWDGSAWPAHGMRDAPDAVSAGPRSAGGVAGLQELLDQLLVEVWEGFQVGDANVFVDFVDAGVDGADLDAVGAEGGDEAGVGGAAAGAFLGRGAGEPGQHLAGGIAQRAFGSEERFAAAVPAQVVVEPVAFK